jgi:hypothetical protein
MIKMTTYTQSGVDHQAIQIGWDQVTNILGHEHDGSSTDDQALVQYLLGNGAPSWVATAEGWIDEFGWGLTSPNAE